MPHERLGRLSQQFAQNGRQYVEDRIPRYIPIPVARGIAEATQFIPERLRRPVIGLADRLPFAPGAAAEIAKRQTWGYFHEILKGAAESKEQLPSKEYQLTAARAELYGQSRIDIMMFYKPFPDRPRRKNKIYPPRTGFFDRRLNALLSPHTSNGLPDEWFLRDADGRYIQREEGLDAKLLHEMYYALPDRRAAYFEMEKIFDEVVRQEIPPVGQDVLNRLRFLGMSNEEEFVNTTEENLLNRINAKINQIAGTNRNKKFSLKNLTEFMNMARQSDAIRRKEDPKHKGKRRTGESYYCHYLASAWFLWTMIEEDLTTEQDVLDALEDVETMMVHDIMEDLPYKLRTQYDPENQENRFFLDLEIPQPIDINGRAPIVTDLSEDITPVVTIEKKGDSDEYQYILWKKSKTLSIELSRNQWLILEAMHKEKDDESGFIWLEKIKNIFDPNDPTPQRKNYLIKKAARCKSADRLANLLTITSAGGPFYDVVRKLNETIYGGKYLAWLSNFGDLGPVGTIDRLKKIAKNNRFVLLLSAIPIIAEMEKRNIMIKFGQKLMEKIRENTDKPWAKQIIYIIDKNIRYPHGGPNPLPYGLRRLEDLKACYRIPSEFDDYILSSENLHHYLSLEQFVQQENFFPQNQPIEFVHFKHLINRLETFEKWMMPYEGILPGGVDDYFGPRPLLYVDFFTIRDMTSEFMEQMAETIAWGKAYEYEEE
ncbi:hypothetical protein M1271_00990 [Patescibacteria group bacterium]|nr:hypothetical protein [Patescibacteria group bacterium]MCL5798436.1 hypothetical protein [Patescibacteria group bacterium]